MNEIGHSSEIGSHYDHHNNHGQTWKGERQQMVDMQPSNNKIADRVSGRSWRKMAQNAASGAIVSKHGSVQRGYIS